MQIPVEQFMKTLAGEAFRSRRLVVTLFVLLNAAALAAGLLGPKKYTSSVSILVDETTIVQPLMQGAAVGTGVESRARNAREVIFGRKIMDQILDHGGWQKDKLSPEEQERLIEEIKKRTKIYNIGRNIIKIEYADDDPERAYHVAAKYADLFIKESAVEKADESRAAFDFIEQQAQVYHEKLQQTEVKLKDLRSSNLEARAGTESEVTARINTLQTYLERTQQELREAEIQAEALVKQVSGEVEITAMATRESQFRTKMAELQSRLDTLRLSYHDSYPDIVQLKEQMQDLAAQVKAERERSEESRRVGRVDSDQAALNNPVYQQLRRQLSETRLRIESLKARIEHTQKQLQQEMARGRLLHATEAQLAELTREYQVNRDIFQDLLRRRENARVSMNLDRERQGPTLRIQEPAMLPAYPSGLRFMHFALGGILLGIAVPIGLLVARLNLDPRIRFASAIPERHRVPVIAVVPHMWTPRELKLLRAEMAMLMLIVGSTIAASGTIVVLRSMKVL